MKLHDFLPKTQKSGKLIVIFPADQVSEVSMEASGVLRTNSKVTPKCSAICFILSLPESGRKGHLDVEGLLTGR